LRPDAENLVDLFALSREMQTRQDVTQRSEEWDAEVKLEQICPQDRLVLAEREKPPDAVAKEAGDRVE
jgi:hypothetical protein